MSKCKTPFQTLCYGINEDLVAQWCRVDLETARLYKSGGSSPCAAELELFLLNLNGRIVPTEWHGFSVRGAFMWDPYGKAFTHGQLRAYELALQMLCELARKDTNRTPALDDLFRFTADPKLHTDSRVKVIGYDPPKIERFASKRRRR
jgi:hypothetical protein